MIVFLPLDIAPSVPQKVSTQRDQLHDDLKGSSDGVLAAMADNLDGQMDRGLERIDEQKQFVSEWDELRVSGIAETFKRQLGILSERSAAAGMTATSKFLDSKAKAVVEGYLKTVGMSNDVSAPARLATLTLSGAAARILTVGALAANTTAGYVAANSARLSPLNEATRTELQFDEEVNAAEAAADVAYMRDQFDLMDSANESEQRIVAQMIENMERDTEVALAYERDLVELRDRRDEVFPRIIENEDLHIAVEQAELAVQQALLNYSRNALSAQLLQGRLVTVRHQLQNVNQLLGSPTAVFAWANQLTVAENRLERAKATIMDWVVALEYFAVRPFFDSRIQILLARNTTQLEAIAIDLGRIQDSCGGAVNTQNVEVSVRNSLLGINRPIENKATGESQSPAERFREIMSAGRIPIDIRVRYSTDATVGDLLNRSGILALSFDIGMNEFANLETTCNAKIRNIAIQLQGDDLGSGLPTVSLLYDGTSRLRSCQPDIAAIVDVIGPQSTPFDQITEFRTPGRSVSPVAGINEFPITVNQSLGGLPISSQYTLLIDKQVGENQSINWENLQDIQLRFEYGYQDLFPSGQCN